MIKSLQIANYALIDKISIEFDKGLTIITGETGAGKSIILGALSLLMGQRAETTVVRDSSQKCFVEAIFDIANYNINEIFTTNNIDYYDTTIIRREILPDGRSRAFVNDMPVNLTTLKEIAEAIIDIHSQHQTLKLNTQQFQIDTLDTIAQNNSLVEQFQQKLKQFNQTQNQLNELISIANKDKAEKEYLQYQFEQIENAKLHPDEQSELENEQNKLQHIEEIKTNLNLLYQSLDNDNISVLSLLKDAQRAANNIKNYLPAAEEFTNRLENAFIDLRDLAREAAIIDQNLALDPERLEYVNNRLDLIYSLQKKFNATNIEQLLNTKQQIEQKLLQINSYDDQINSLQLQLENLNKQLSELAQNINQNRVKAKPFLEKQIVDICKSLGMPEIQFNIEITFTKEFNNYGCDKVEFLFSANRSIAPQPVAKIASGGELSRLMLAIKYIISHHKRLPTIIFDEIDTGVSGEIASKMGSLLKQMSLSMQIINITHLPQIAAKGNNHFFVYKKTENNTTTTNIRLLNTDERIVEIAKMLSGENLTPTAIENAKILLTNS